MAALPSPSKVAGSHLRLYEAYYLQVDPRNTGAISALDAAKFLKKSGLSDVVLGKIWDLSDPLGKGYLDQNGFFVALKLISLAQQGKEVNMSLLSSTVDPPRMGDAPPIPELPKVSVWSVKPQEKFKYNQLFDSLSPVNNSLPGSKVKPLMVNSGLPVDALGKIWDLADMDKDGALDRTEFIIAMHLIYKILDNNPIPSVLPPELRGLTLDIDAERLVESKSMPPPVPVPPVHHNVHPSPVHPPPPVPPPPVSSIPILTSVIEKSIPSIPWVVTAEEKAKYDVLFQQTDTDKDGFVNGTEIKDVFLQSGLAQNVLAHIWNLCDIKQTGKLNEEQFALAMWLIAQKLTGIDPPTTLHPEMVPPTFRPKPAPVPDLVSSLTSVSYSNPELQMLAKEIEELSGERVQLQQDVTQKQAELRIRQSEVRNLQTELDTLTATLKQLENQKGEAQKRLDDLGAQKTSIESELEEVVEQIAERRGEVDKLRAQVEEQETSLNSQKCELDGKKKELEDLKSEESKLESEVEMTKTRLDTLTTNLADTQLQINQAKNKLMSLQDQHQQLTDLVETYDSAISTGDASSISDAALRTITPSWEDYEYRDLPVPSTPSSSAFSSLGQEEKPVDFSQRNGFHEDVFSKGDPFSSTDHFNNAFNDPIQDPFKSEPFAAFPSGGANNDPFQPTTQSSFGLSSTINAGTDPFGSDPFAPARNESPTPALPPKKSKQPPPRPAPPKQAPGKGSSSKPPVPAPPAHHTPTPHESDPFGDGDPFASGKSPFSASNNDGFADFANFDQFHSGASSTWSDVSNIFDKSTDPFSDPFSDPASVWAETKVGHSQSKTANISDDPFGFRPSPIGAADKVLKEEDFWEESRRQEVDRQQRVKQEQEDFELAMALSRVESSIQ